MSCLLIIGCASWIGVALFKKADNGPVSLADAKSTGQVRAVTKDELLVDEKHQEEMAHEINKMHKYLNDLLGWGAWQSFKPVDKEEELKERMKYIREQLVPESKGTLKSDFNRAADGIESALEKDETKQMLITHRIFHDLDVVLNDTVVDVYWGVTETYGQ